MTPPVDGSNVIEANAAAIASCSSPLASGENPTRASNVRPDAVHPAREELPVRVAPRLGRVDGNRFELDRPGHGRRAVERQRLLLDRHE